MDPGSMFCPRPQKACILSYNIAAKRVEERHCHVARFTTQIKPVLQQMRLLTGSNRGW